MASKYDSQKKTIGELLSLTSPPIRVPEWQRNYSWEDIEVDEFWQDLLRFSKKYDGENIQGQEYFLGSIVLVDDGTSHLLLDGQQRLATATILLSVIRDAIAEFKADAAAQVSNKYISEIDHGTNTATFKLTLNRFDRDFFRREIQEYGATDAPAIGLSSHELLREARQFFGARFGEELAPLESGKERFDWAIRILRVLTGHMSVVAVSSKDEDNAAGVFETLNDRGIGLSTPDLLRNLVLRRANEEDYDEILDCWRVVLEVEEEAYVETFLRHFWISLKGDIKQRSLYREIKDEVTAKDVSSLELSRMLRDAAETYKEIVAARDDDPEMRRLLTNISMLGAKALLPAVLSTWTVEDQQQRQRMVRGLLTLFVRHTLICQLQNSRLESVVFEIAKDLRSTGDVDAAITRIREFAPTDESFVDRFGTVSIHRQKSARYILKELEETTRATKELAVETPDRVHVEHIYPRSPLEGERFENHDAIVNRVGNLTLLAKPLYQAIKNAAFDDKREAYESSDLVLTKDLLKNADWSPETIGARQAELAELALQNWPLPE